VHRLKRDEMLPYAQAFYAACLAEGFPEFPNENHPESTGIGPVPSNNRDGVRVSTALAYLHWARHRLNLTMVGSLQREGVWPGNTRPDRIRRRRVRESFGKWHHGKERELS